MYVDIEYSSTYSQYHTAQSLMHKIFNRPVFFCGMLGGVYLAGVPSDKFGRKRIIIALQILMSVQGVITAYMPTIETFIAARFIHALIYVGETGIV